MTNSILPTSTANPTRPTQTERKPQANQSKPVRFGDKDATKADSDSFSLQIGDSKNPEYALVNWPGLLKAIEGKGVNLKNAKPLAVKNPPPSIAEQLTDYSKGNEHWGPGRKAAAAWEATKDRIFNMSNFKMDLGVSTAITVATCWLPGSQLIFIPTYLAIANSSRAVLGAWDGWHNPGRYLDEIPDKLAKRNNEDAPAGVGSGATPAEDVDDDDEAEAPAGQAKSPQPQGSDTKA